MFAELSVEKGSADGLPLNLIKRRRAKRTEVTELYFFCYNEQNQLAYFFKCKVHLAENSTSSGVVLMQNTVSYFNVKRHRPQMYKIRIKGVRQW